MSRIPLDVSPTGSLVKTFQGHNAVAITDVNDHDTDFIDVSVIKDKTLKVVNLLNQPVDISLLLYDGISTYPHSTGVKNVGSSIAMMLTDADFANLLSKPYSKVKIRAKCATAPTSGSVTTIIEGATR